MTPNHHRFQHVLMIWTVIAALWWLPLSAMAEPQTYQPAQPGYTYAFPDDLKAHPDYKTEWWYYTGHLNGDNGAAYGYELTFFRIGNPFADRGNSDQWGVDNLYMAHFAVSDKTGKTFFHTQQLNRPGGGKAGASDKRYNVWNGSWTGEWRDGAHHITANSPDYSLSLTLTPDKPPVIHGENGVSQKADCDGCASHYFSYTRLKTEGTLTVGDGQPTKVTGLSWMDQEFGSNQLADNQAGWDWFSIQLDNQTELMLYQLRLKDGSVDPNSSGTWVPTAGPSKHLSLGSFTITPTEEWTSPHSNGTYPMGWIISVPDQDLTLTITPAFQDQELHQLVGSSITYWEGACQVAGSVAGKLVSGQAYVEMTGYSEPFKEKI